MKYYTNLLVLSLFCAFGYNAEWYTVEGKQWKTNFVEICTEEAMVDMGAEFYEYATELKDYCTCMMDTAAKAYASPQEAEWAVIQNQEEYYATILQYGGEDCLNILMKMLLEIEGE